MRAPGISFERMPLFHQTDEVYTHNFIKTYTETS